MTDTAAVPRARIYLNRSEVAATIGVHPQTLYMWSCEGAMMPGDIKIGMAPTSRPLYGWTHERAMAFGAWIGALTDSGTPTGATGLPRPQPDADGRWPDFWHVTTTSYLSRSDLHLVWGVKKASVSVRSYRGSLPEAAVETGTTSGHGIVTGYSVEEVLRFTRQSERLDLACHPDDLGEVIEPA